MYAEHTNNKRINLMNLTFEEAQLLTQSLIELKGKLRGEELFIRELEVCDRMYKEIDRELLHGV